jgi:hypothetical protein
VALDQIDDLVIGLGPCDVAALALDLAGHRASRNSARRSERPLSDNV